VPFFAVGVHVNALSGFIDAGGARVFEEYYRGSFSAPPGLAVELGWFGAARSDSVTAVSNIGEASGAAEFVSLHSQRH
jgi:hypothetical protein